MAARPIIGVLAVQGDFSERFMRAYAQSVDWILSGDQKPMEHYAELLKTDLATAIKLRDQFWNRQILAVEKVRGSDLIMQDAVEGKFLTKPLTKEELNQLIAPHARP